MIFCTPHEVHVSDIKRKVRNQRDATELLRELEASGQDLASFCFTHGIDGRSLRCWRMNQGRRLPAPASTRPPALRLVEVTAAPPRPAGSYRVRVGDIVVEVDDNFREDTLGRLLHVVRAC